MADRKTERLLNLIFILLVTRQYLSKERIRVSIADYRGLSQQAFERKFERDKEELRELGIDIEVGGVDPYFDDDPGYRIDRDNAELPDLDLTGQEAAMLGLAAQVWQHAGLAKQATAAVTRLKAAGIAVDPDVVQMSEPKLSANEPAFDAMLRACTECIPVAFDYRRPGQEASRRHVQPWAVVSWRGRWYLHGYDTDRDDVRLFRLSRICGEVSDDGPPGSYSADQSSNLDQMFSAEPERIAVLQIAPKRANSLRRRAVSQRYPVDGEPLEVRYGSQWDMAAEIASYGPDVRVISPPELRDAVIEQLRAALGEAS